MIRRIGEANGEGPSATIQRLARKELDEMPTEAPPEVRARRRAALEALRCKHPRDDRFTLAEIKEGMDAMYDYLDAFHPDTSVARMKEVYRQQRSIPRVERHGDVERHGERENGG